MLSVFILILITSHLLNLLYNVEIAHTPICNKDTHVHVVKSKYCIENNRMNEIFGNSTVTGDKM